MRLTKDQLKDALEILGLEFTEEQRDMMLPGVNRALDQLRRSPQNRHSAGYRAGVPLPPVAAGKRAEAARVKIRADFGSRTPPSSRPLRMSKTWRFFQSPSSRRWLKRRRSLPPISPRCIWRASRNTSPKLLCVITLTEDHALEQAGEADKEIRAGKYRGPLHGIPFGAKDLFNTKGHPDHLGRRAVQRPGPHLQRHLHRPPV